MSLSKTNGYRLTAVLATAAALLSLWACTMPALRLHWQGEVFETQVISDYGGWPVTVMWGSWLILMLWLGWRPGNFTVHFGMITALYTTGWVLYRLFHTHRPGALPDVAAGEGRIEAAYGLYVLLAASLIFAALWIRTMIPGGNYQHTHNRRGES